MSTYVDEVRELAEECVTHMVREELHGVALCVVSLPDCDGMTPEYLFSQPACVVGDYLEDIGKEV